MPKKALIDWVWKVTRKTSKRFSELEETKGGDLK